MNITKLLAGAVVLASAAWVTKASAYTIYGNSASFGNNPLHFIDSNTGVEQQRFTGQPSGNGRGVVTVGNKIYYTVVNDPKIYIMDKTTGLTTGSILTQNQSMSTLAWDGKYFWTADYSGTNRAFQIDPVTGNNIKTINLANASNFMDGLEYFNGKLIGNRCDGAFGGNCGIYDVYDLNGNLLQSAFITSTAPSQKSTGIAFDGTNFLLSNINNNSIGLYDGSSGAFIKNINLTSQQGSFLIEDISVDYADRPDTGGGGENVPEPTTMLGLLAFGSLGASSLKRKEKQQAEI
jgi:glutamine cyclotransferase